MENIYVAIYINNRNTYLAISDEKDSHKIIDMSYGYGKTYSKSVVVFSDGEFSFLENAMSSDIFDDTVVYESILEIMQGDEVEIDGTKFEKKDILAEFLKDLLKYVHEQGQDKKIKKICVCYEQGYRNIDNIFIDAFSKVDIGKDKVTFVTPKEALYFEALKSVDNDVNICFIDNEKTTTLNLTKNLDGSYKETEKTIDSFSINMFCNHFIETMTEFYKNSKGSNISEEERLNIKKLFYENIELIVSKYLLKEDCKIYYNFAFPPIALDVTYEFSNKLLVDTMLKVEIVKNSFVYVEEVSSKIVNVIREDFNNISMLNGILYKAKNVKSSIDIKDIKDIKYDYGFMINKGGKDVFLPIVKKDDSYLTKIKDQYFYLKKSDESLVLYRYDGEYIPVYDLDLKDLNSLSEYVKIKMGVKLTQNNSLVIEFTNEGFLDKVQREKVFFEINEV